METIPLIELSHIGEELICELINRSDTVRQSLEIANSALTHQCILAVSEIRLNSCAGFIFDGVHKVDICILNKN